jgi:hypothetical protein
MPGQMTLKANVKQLSVLQKTPGNVVQCFVCSCSILAEWKDSVHVGYNEVFAHALVIQSRWTMMDRTRFSF